MPPLPAIHHTRGVPVGKRGTQRRRKTPAPRLTASVRTAILAMVFGPDEGPHAGKPLRRAEAAAFAGIGDPYLRDCLSNPEIMKFWNEQLEVLRSGARPRALVRMIELSDQDAHRPTAFNASKFLLTDGREDGGGGPQVVVQINQQPGYVIAVDPQYAQGQQQPPQLMPNAAKPLIEHASVPASGSERLPERPR